MLDSIYHMTLKLLSFKSNFLHQYVHNFVMESLDINKFVNQ